MTVNERIERCGIVPVVVLDDKEDAISLAKALIKGGIDVCEVTFRTDAAKESIEHISLEVPEMLVGAGTVLTIKQLEMAVESGAKFIVSPGYDSKIVKRAKELKVDVFPGVVTPTEIINALNDGLDIVKFFPAGSFGGLKTIKALSGPFTNVRFMPTGGVNSSNLKEFLEFDKIFAVGGSWICDKKLVKEKKFDEITRLSKEARDIFKSVRW